MSVGAGHYAALSAIVFALGLFGVLSRSNGFATLFALVLLLLAPVIALVGFAHLGVGQFAPVGDALAVFAAVAAAAELVLGVGLALVVWRRLGSVDADDLADVTL